MVGVLALPPGRVRRVVAPAVVLDRLAQRVDPEAVGAARDPEAQDVRHRLAHGGVAPVEVWLLREVGVVVERACRLVPRPGRTAEHAHPVGGGVGSSRHRYQSRALARRRTRGAVPRCGWGRSRGSAAGRARAPRRPVDPSPRACRTAGRRPRGRTRHSRSRPSASGRTATARPRPPRATRDTAAGSDALEVADAVSVASWKERGYTW